MRRVLLVVARAAGAFAASAAATPAPSGMPTYTRRSSGWPATSRPGSGRRLAYALMVNDVGAIEDIEGDVAEVFEDGAAIANAVCEAVR
jgi:hypothetical protein